MLEIGHQDFEHLRGRIYMNKTSVSVALEKFGEAVEEEVMEAKIITLDFWNAGN